ncbi:alginate O-acetyltransferase AlgF [Tropicimonas marinistellae]|uniref:alginate O-acetyltransferase AlgF n=1 Tax=Tropicimonas marinistellae TaxID=1739787 RepID=UPI000834AD8B|nr:alginate O-acetyltransferase AlgF [Tropicimonas marinistellae]
MKPRIRFFALVSVTVLNLTGAANAQSDNGLYQDVRDPDASFVRLIVPGKNYGKVASAGISDLQNGVSNYIHVEPGEIKVAVEGAESSFTVAPRSFYSVILADDGTPVPLPDTLQSNPAKADIAFFNLTDADELDLFVPRAKANVAQGISAGQNSSVAVKAPLTLDFEIKSGDAVLASVPGVELRRKEGVTIIVTGRDGAYSAFAHENSFVN